MSGPRSLNTSQWGMVCPADTPEGEVTDEDDQSDFLPLCIYLLCVVAVYAFIKRSFGLSKSAKRIFQGSDEVGLERML